MSPSPPFIGRMCCSDRLILFFLACFLNFSWAVERHVSVTGLDTNGGTVGFPWRTIGKAALSSLPGDLVYIHGGTYAEAVTMRVSGTDPNAAGTGPKGYITFQSFPGETAIIDGTTVVPAANDSTGLIRMASRSYLIFRDLELRNLKASVANNSDVLGVFMSGTSHHVEVRNCKIHDIQVLPTANGIANGIGVYGTNGTSASTAINNIVIDGCEIYNLKTGFSESVTFNGNVDGFQITNCSIHDCDNIGIDCIGFEGTAVGVLDQARNGLVARNTIYNIDSLLNPAYAGHRGAGGIYVDGGKLITVEGNTVHHCNIGIELASEAAGQVTSDCMVRNNFVYQCHLGGLFLGGADGLDNGGAQNCQILNNTLFQNDTDATGSGEILFQFNVTGVTIKQNILSAGVDSSGDSYFIQDPNGTITSGHTVNRNLYFSAAGNAARTWMWRGVYYLGLTNWQIGTGQDAQGSFANPLFVSSSLAAPNLHLTAPSPARNTGDAAFIQVSGELEIDAQPRITETLVDLGADEFVPTITISSTDTAAAEWTANTASYTLTRSAGNIAGIPQTVALNITGNATNGLDYPTLTTVTIPAGSTSATFTLTPVADNLAEGPETLLILPTAVSGSQINGSALPVTITITDRPLQQWKFTHFTTQANNPSIAADTADPDGDGRSNLLEYATGTLPLTANPGPLITVANVSGFCTATVVRSASPVDITVIPQISNNLTTWSGTPALVITENTATKLQFRDASTVSAASKRYLRLKVTAP